MNRIDTPLSNPVNPVNPVEDRKVAKNLVKAKKKANRAILAASHFRAFMYQSDHEVMFASVQC
jgi:hypothetical protein